MPGFSSTFLTKPSAQWTPSQDNPYAGQYFPGLEYAPKALPTGYQLISTPSPFGNVDWSGVSPDKQAFFQSHAPNLAYQVEPFSTPQQQALTDFGPGSPYYSAITSGVNPPSSSITSDLTNLGLASYVPATPGTTTPSEIPYYSMGKSGYVPGPTAPTAQGAPGTTTGTTPPTQGPAQPPTTTPAGTPAGTPSQTSGTGGPGGWWSNYLNQINYGFNFNYPNFANQSMEGF